MVREEKRSADKRRRGATASSTSATSNVTADTQRHLGEKMLMNKNWMVRTPYGVARVVRVYYLEGNYYYNLELVGWNAKMTTSYRYPSVEPQIGSEVVLTCFNPSGGNNAQRGRVIAVRPNTRQAVVRLVNWQLMQRGHQSRFVTCYLSYSSLQVMASKKLKRMSSTLR